MILSMFVLLFLGIFAFPIVLSIFEDVRDFIGISRTRNQVKLVWGISIIIGVFAIVSMANLLMSQGEKNWHNFIIVLSFLAFFGNTIIYWRKYLSSFTENKYDKLYFIAEGVLLSFTDSLFPREAEFIKVLSNDFPDGKYYYTGTNNPVDKALLIITWIAPTCIVNIVDESQIENV